MEIPPPNGMITLLSDFGLQDPYVGIMKGVIKQRHARAEIVDLCHDVPAQDVAAGALFASAAVGRFPAGTVHVAVVDPGVGTDRRVLVACACQCYWVAPDNGLLTSVLASAHPVEVRAADLSVLGLRPSSNTFWGRDVFAPLGALLSGRRYGFRAVGACVEDPVRLDSAATGGARVLVVDHFGNLITGVRADEVTARRVTAVEVNGQCVPLRRTYHDVAPGDALALINSYDLLEIAVCEGSAAATFGADRGNTITLLEGVRE